MKKIFVIWAMILLTGFSAGVHSQQATEIILEEGLDDYEGTRDTTIYDESSKSNGGGAHMFAGQTVQGSERRGLISFDLSQIPEGATITAASLQLTISKTRAGGTDVFLHRLTKDWGEGVQDAPNQEGGGTLAAEGDATWNENFRTDSSWDNRGGDFIEAASAEAVAGGPDSQLLLEGAGLTADIQAWINGEADNFGWILVADGTAKRFHSSESEIAETGEKPRLVISYTTN